MLNDPSIAALEADIIVGFQKGASAVQILNEAVTHLSEQRDKTVVDLLLLALFRNWIKFFDPPVLSSDLAIGKRVWEYWNNHPEELKEVCAEGNAIASYLTPLGMDQQIREAAAQHAIEVLSRDQIAQAWPFIQSLQTRIGAPVKVRPRAAQALQMSLGGRKWREVTDALCDCGAPKQNHPPGCMQKIRQSVIDLKDVLRKCGVELQKGLSEDTEEEV